MLETPDRTGILIKCGTDSVRYNTFKSNVIAPTF